MRAARTLPALVLAVGVAGCVAGCGSTPHTSDVSATKNRSRVIAAGDEYVAIGDSYTAAPYTAASTADDGCIQSATNYPHQVAAKLGLKLKDVSCGGAVTGSVTGSQKTSTGATKPAQIDAVSSKTALVTVSLGGNDGQIVAALTTTCVTAAQAPGAGEHPCADLDAIGHKSGTGTVDRIHTMQQHLVEALQAIIARAPHARIIVVGYPHTVPAKPCAQYPLAPGDASWATRVTKEVVAAQRKAATAVGAEFVDMYQVSTGHDICSSDPWAAGEHPTAAAAPFHPYAVEQAEVASRIEQALATTP